MSYETKIEPNPTSALDSQAAMTATLCRHLSTGQPLPPWGDVVEEARGIAYRPKCPTCKQTAWHLPKELTEPARVPMEQRQRAAELDELREHVGAKAKKIMRGEPDESRV